METCMRAIFIPPFYLFSHIIESYSSFLSKLYTPVPSVLCGHQLFVYIQRFVYIQLFYIQLFGYFFDLSCTPVRTLLVLVVSILSSFGAAYTLCSLEISIDPVSLIPNDASKSILL
eukprot:768870_1